MTVHATTTEPYGTVGLEVGLVGRWFRLVIGITAIVAVTYRAVTEGMTEILLGQVGVYFGASLVVYTHAC